MGDRNRSFFAAVEESLNAAAERAVLESGGDRFTGAELLSEIERWSAGLAAAGVRRGDRVAVQAEKSIELVLLYLATLRLGAIYLPLNGAYRPSEVAFFLDDADPVVFVHGPEAEEAYSRPNSQTGAQRFTLDQGGRGSLADVVNSDNPAVPAAHCLSSDLAAIVYTSGTTGRSKGAMITHDNLLSNARALIAAWALGPNDVLLHALPLFHIHGLFVALNTMLLAGGRVEMLPTFTVEEVLARLPGATIFMGVPTYYTRLLAHGDFGATTAASVRLFICGSAPLPAPKFEEFQQRTGQAILERYGMSECGIICSNPLLGPRIAGAVGPPLPGVEVRIAEGADVGVLEVRGPNVFAGYWRQPEKTRAEFRDDGFFVTGDVATIDDAGVVRIVGRDKDMIISGGLNVYPKEIETLIDTFPEVDESAVIGLPHPDFGEVAAAVVRLRSASPEQDPLTLIERLKTDLASFKVPKVVFIVDELPRNAMGKVQKSLLREQYRNHFGA
jgi:malonyl-CoA/methylmalonyl-CoA synthetase